MARTFNLVDSASVLSSISLINTSGIQGVAGGLGGASLDAEQVYADSPLMGTELVESFDLNVYGSSQDNTASIMQALAKMLRKARQFVTAPWQTAPVYLQAQHATETGARYAQVKGVVSLGLPDTFNLAYEADARLEGVTLDLIREHPWRGTAPGSLPTAQTLVKTDGSVNATTVHVVPVHHTQAITHIYCYDAAPAWSANLVGTTGFTLWAVSGSTPAAGDIIYFGSNSRVAFNVVVPIATAGVFTADIIAEYGSGGGTAGWGALTEGTQFTAYPTGGLDELFKSTGEWVLSWQPPADWGLATVNGVSAYWVRLRLNTVSAWTTTPVSHATQTPYTQKKPYFEIGSSGIGGDAPPRLLFRFKAPYGGATTEGMGLTSRILIGAKSRNLTNFVSQLHLHNYGLPANWTRTAGTDTTEVADVRAPEGYHAAVSFATTVTEAVRMTLVGDDLWDDYAGAYRAILIAEQAGGAAGDTEVKLRVLQGSASAGQPYIDTPTVALQGASEGFEAIDLGIIQIPFGPVVYADSLSADLVFQVFAARPTGSATLKLSRLVLLPVDEWFFMADDPVKDTTSGSSALRGNSILDADFDVLANRTLKYLKDGSNWIPSEIWHRTSAVSRILPGTGYRFFCLIEHYPTTFGTAPLVVSSGAHLAVEVYAVNSYLSLRGAG